MPQHGLDVRIWPRKSNSDAGLDIKRDVFHQKRPMQDVGEALCGGYSFGRTRVAQEDRELVATEPRYRVTGSHSRSETLGNLAEQQVAIVVPEGVVDILEPIEVDQHYGYPRARSSRSGERVRSAILEEFSVR